MLERLDAARTGVEFSNTITTSEAHDFVSDAFIYNGAGVGVGDLDGDGREESRKLARAVALAYATESMRLTTRLMQIASWLLIQRAANEGEMNQAQAQTEKSKVKLTQGRTTVSTEAYGALPERLRSLIEHTDRLQARVLMLGVLAATVLFAAGCDRGAGQGPPPWPNEVLAEATGYYCGMLLTDHEGPKGQIHLSGREKPLWFSSVRDTIAFPKNQRGVDPLTLAPAPIDEAQLLELGLKVAPATRAAPQVAEADGS